MKKKDNIESNSAGQYFFCLNITYTHRYFIRLTNIIVGTIRLKS